MCDHTSNICEKQSKAVWPGLCARLHGVSPPLGHLMSAATSFATLHLYSLYNALQCIDIFLSPPLQSKHIIGSNGQCTLCYFIVFCATQRYLHFIALHYYCFCLLLYFISCYPGAYQLTYFYCRVLIMC